MPRNDQIVYVVDDDDAVRDSLLMLIGSVGLEAVGCRSAGDFLAVFDAEPISCLILDIRMPGMSGLALQERLHAEGVLIPIIFVTGHGDVPIAVRAMKTGAFDFIEKPINDQLLLDSVNSALEADRAQRQMRHQQDAVRSRVEQLSMREREVLDLMLQGLPNKAIANELGISAKTVEAHRSKIFEKMRAESFAELVRMAVSGSAD